MSTRRWLAILPLFALSGVSGVVYQVLWVRQFGLAFGNTTYSAAVVTAAFMSGLGLGSWYGGVLADRWHAAGPRRVLTAYGLAEIGIGIAGASLAWALPRLAALSPAISTYAPGAHGWSHLGFASYALRYAVAFLALAPPTILMGSTLALLVRHAVPSDTSRAGASVALLYGVNTIGAAAGAVLAQLVLVPRVGILRAQLAAAVINVAVGAAAVALARSDAAAPSGATAPEREASTSAQTSGADRRVVLAAFALALTGFAGMSLEIIWLRFLLSAINGYASSFALLLTVVLVGIWGGSTLAGALLRRWNRPGTTFAIAAALLVVAVMASLLQHHRADLISWFMSAHNELDDPEGLPASLQLWGVARTIVLVAGVPSLLMGVTFPLANAVAQRAADRVGRRAGQLYLANTVGATAGSLVTGFALLPAIGTQGAVLVATGAICASIAAIGLAARHEGRRAPAVVGASLVVAVGAVVAWGVGLPRGHLLAATLPAFAESTQVLDVHEGAEDTLAITLDASGTRRLWTNGHSMSSTAPRALRYMRAFAHIPLLMLDQPKRGLVICFGVGNTAHAALLHPSIETFEIADLSSDILARADFFEATNEGVLRDPRARVFVDDGRHHLLMAEPGAYDLVTLEPPPIAFAGVGALYSSEFYALAKSRLTPDGYVSQWLPIYQLSDAAARSAIRSFVDVFPNAVLLSGDRRELILLGRKEGPVEIDPEQLARRLAERPRVQRDLDEALMGTLTDIVGAFVASPAALHAATATARPVTDDDPIMEHAFLSWFYVAHIPPDVFRVEGVDAWCPTCAGRADLVPHLREHLELLDTMYASDAFLTYKAFAGARSTMVPPPDPDGRYAQAIGASPYLQSLVPPASVPAPASP